jgi:hypothetical protein
MTSVAPLITVSIQQVLGRWVLWTDYVRPQYPTFPLSFWKDTDNP